MTPHAPLPPIEDILPHRGSMLLLDRVIDADAENAWAEYTPRREAWYADPNGNMPAWIGIELMAQAVAAQVSLLKRREGLPLKLGALLGTRRYTSTCSVFLADTPLRIHAKMILCDATGLGAYECHIDSQGELLASASLKVFEPDDFQTFLQASTL